MKSKLIFLTLLSALLLCSCGAGSGTAQSGIEGIMSDAGELNQTDDNKIKVLPDGISLDDTEHTIPLEADSSGVIMHDKFGVKFTLPQGYKAYLYACDPEYDYANSNTTCEAAIFLVNPFFPQTSDFIRISFGNALVPNCFSFEEVNEPLNEGLFGGPYRNEAEYYENIKLRLKTNFTIFEKYEAADEYDYIGANKQRHENMIDPNSNENTCDSPLIFDYTGRAYSFAAARSSSGKKVSEFIELDNGACGIHISYDLTRYGNEMTKEVYWLYTEGEQFMRRVEFSYDKQGSLPMDEKAFLEAIDIYTPTYAENAWVCEGRFFDRPKTEEE